jgi:uridine phosphorylase
MSEGATGGNDDQGHGGYESEASDDRQYHLEVASGDVASTVLLPGDTERVDKIVSLWDEAEEVATHREYRTVTGTYEGTPVSVTSTGIGSPSAAIAVEELAECGVDTFLRVGSCGAIQPNVSVGDLVVTSGAARQEGTSEAYVRESYPAVADFEIVTALVAAAERLGYDYHVGITASTDSFYAGQGRAGFEDYLPERGRALYEELQGANVKNFEMEAAAITTLANVFGLRAGAICTVYANRVTGEFRTEGESRAAETASLAAHLLARMDEVKADAGAKRWHAGLSLNLD